MSPQAHPEILSRTAWSEKGRAVLPDAVPVEVWRHRVGSRKTIEYGVYSIEQTRPKPQKATPVRIDLISAIFAVNRAAKRFRDAASAQYESDNHGFAGHASRTKSHLYDLKDRGIAEALRLGLLIVEGVHGGMVIYRGVGTFSHYSFHSFQFPVGAHATFPVSGWEEDPMQDAHDRMSGEARLMDAEFTLESLPGASCLRPMLAVECDGEVHVSASLADLFPVILGGRRSVQSFEVAEALGWDYLGVEGLLHALRAKGLVCGSGGKGWSMVTRGEVRPLICFSDEAQSTTVIVDAVEDDHGKPTIGEVLGGILDVMNLDGFTTAELAKELRSSTHKVGPLLANLRDQGLLFRHVGGGKGKGLWSASVVLLDARRAV